MIVVVMLLLGSVLLHFKWRRRRKFGLVARNSRPLFGSRDLQRLRLGRLRGCLLLARLLDYLRRRLPAERGAQRLLVRRLDDDLRGLLSPDHQVLLADDNFFILLIIGLVLNDCGRLGCTNLALTGLFCA